MQFDQLRPRLEFSFMDSSQASVAKSVDVVANDAVIPPGERRSTTEYFSNLWHDDWSHMSGSIILAAFVYPFVLSGIFIAVGVHSMLVGSLAGQAITLPEIALSLVVGIVSLVLAAFFGMIWAAYVNALITPLLHAMLRSLEMQPRAVWYGAFKGGLVGFLAVLPLGYFTIARSGKSLDWFGLLALFAVGPCLTTILGQVGGARGGWKSKSYDRAIASAQVAPMRDEEASNCKHKRGTASGGGGSLRFRIRHMLWVTLWLSGLFAMIRLIGIPFGVSFAVLFGWIGFQALTLCLGAQLILRLGPWLTRRRQTRST